MVSHDLEEGSNVIIHSGHVKIATFVAGSLKPFVVNRFGEVAIGHLSKFFCAHDLLLQNVMAVLETSKNLEIRKKNKKIIRVKMHQFHEATPLSISKVPEGQPKLKVFQPLLGGAVGRSPPGLDG
jgi:hypothetical protein